MDPSTLTGPDCYEPWATTHPSVSIKAARSAVEPRRADLMLDQAVQPRATPEKLLLDQELSPAAVSLGQAIRDATDKVPADTGWAIRFGGATSGEVGQGMAEKSSGVDHGHAPS